MFMVGPCPDPNDDHVNVNNKAQSTLIYANSVWGKCSTGHFMVVHIPGRVKNINKLNLNADSRVGKDIMIIECGVSTHPYLTLV